MIIGNKIRPQLIVLCAAFIYSTEVSALETDSSDFKINGFGTVGLTKNSDQDLGFRQTVSQEGIFDEYNLSQNSDLGIQANYYATDKLNFGIQLLAKKRNENSLDKSIQWAYVNYKISPKVDIKLGRIGAGGFMMSDYRHVGFTHLWTHLPTEFYGSHPVSSIDGVDLVFKESLFDGLLRARLWSGQATYDFYSTDSYEINLDKLFGGGVTWENDIWNLRISYSQSKAGLENNTIKPLEQALHNASLAGWPAAGNFTNLAIDNKMVRYYTAGVSYDDADWLIQSELGFVDIDSLLTPGTVSGYLSIGRKLGAVTPFVVGAWTKATDDKLTIPTPSIAAYFPLQQISQYAFNQFYVAQHTLSIGARWDVLPKVALKAQWDKTWVDEYGSLLLSKRDSAIAEKKQLDIFSISVDFIF
tara:strand:- start:7 stop:1251 length:1245 start_codon:yes stop_codon:yes gene_type:complete